jgi:hypothetical protein
MLIQERLIGVMRDVGAVGKNDRNSAQNFAFRGIDAVINAVYPALIKNGVVIVPSIEKSNYETIEIGAKRTMMGHAQVTVSYTFYGLDGDSITARVSAEAMDAGDKATAKAMSVAMRTALLQTLALPTGETDPDASSYERSTRATKAEKAEVVATPEQVNLAVEAAAQVSEIETIEELRNFYTGAQEAGLLHIPMGNGVNLNALISARKKELDGALA